MNKIKQNLYNIFFLVLAGAYGFLPKVANAAEDPAITNCHNFKAQFYGAFDWMPDRYCTASGVALFVIQLLVNMAGVAVVLWLTIGGFLYMTSSGSEEQAEKGKKIIINAIIGLVVIILAGAAVRIISNLITAQ